MEEVTSSERLRQAARAAETAKGELLTFHRAASAKKSNARQRGYDNAFSRQFGRVERAWYLSENPAESPEFSASVSKTAEKLDAFDRSGAAEWAKPPRRFPFQAGRKEGPQYDGMPLPSWNEYVADPSKMDLRAWLARLPLHLAKADPNPGFGYEGAFRRALR